MTALSGLVGFCMLVIRLAMAPSLYPLGSGQIRSVWKNECLWLGFISLLFRFTFSHVVMSYWSYTDYLEEILTARSGRKLG